MESWDLLMDFIADQSTQYLTNSKQVYGMRLAGEEILSNMIRENRDDSATAEQAHIWINSYITSSGNQSWFDILLEDNGPHFDPKLEIPREIGAATPIGERAIGGLGLFLVQQSVDEASYQRVEQRNRYRLRMNLS